MNILLTGSSGYIGSQLIRYLKGGGHKVTGIDREPSRSIQLDHFVQADLRNTEGVDAAVKDVDLVLHLAAAKGDWGITAREFFRDNVEATRVLLERGKLAGVKSWIFYSTVSTLGPSKIPLDESAPYSPAIPYGASKAEAEKLFRQVAAEHSDVRVVIVRPSVVFGPKNPANTNIYRLADAIYRNRFIMIGEGREIKTTSYIENLIAATLFLMDRMTAGLHTYIYVDEPPMSTADLVGRLYDLLGKRQPSWRLSLKVAKSLAYAGDLAASLTGRDLPITAARIEKFCTATNFDASAIRRLGFEQPVSMDQALETTVEWYLEQQRSTVSSIAQWNEHCE